MQRQEGPRGEMPPGSETEIARVRAPLESTAAFVTEGREITEAMLAEEDSEWLRKAETAGRTLAGEVGKIGDLAFHCLVKEVPPFERAVLHAARRIITKREEEELKKQRRGR